MELNVVFASDENYVQHMAVAMQSLMINNRDDFDKIHIHILDNHISTESKNKLEEMGQKAGANISLFFHSQNNLEEIFHPNVNNHPSISMYSRLLIGSVLPQDVDRAIYIDSDGVIVDSLRPLYDFALDDAYIAAVIDGDGPDERKEYYHIPPEQPYFNSGFLLFNLKKWREDHIEQELIKMVNEFPGTIHYHDQDVLNAIVGNRTKILPLKYNLKPVDFFRKDWVPSIVRKYNEILPYQPEYYSYEEIKQAKKEPVFIHYHRSGYGRPWTKPCYHPLKNVYLKYLKMTPWKYSKRISRHRGLIIETKEIILKMMRKILPYKIWVPLFYRRKTLELK